MLQLHVRGVDGKTITINFEASTTKQLSVKELKIKIKEKIGLGIEEQRLIYGGKQLEDDKRLCDYSTLEHGSTIFLVMRLSGGCTQLDRKIDHTLPRSADYCMISMEQNSATIPVFVMPCGHPMCPDALMDYCWSEIGLKKCEIHCPLCNFEWTIGILCKYGCVTKAEKEQVEIGLSNNFCLTDQNILECPSCTSFCERRDNTKLCVQCVICSKKKGSRYQFCWQCLGEWKNDHRAETCGNKNCGSPELLKQLMTSPMVTPTYLKDSDVKCPQLRACTNCGTVIELASGCKHMICKSCKHEFCFLCLRSRMNGSWPCGSYNTVCIPAPRQIRIPQRSK